MPICPSRRSGQNKKELRPFSPLTGLGWVRSWELVPQAAAQVKTKRQTRSWETQGDQSLQHRGSEAEKFGKSIMLSLPLSSPTFL